MARLKVGFGLGVRLTDFLGWGLLGRVFPLGLVGEVLDVCGVNSVRVRRVPASVVVYLCMGLSLWPEAAVEDVFSVLGSGLVGGVVGASKSSISAARSRVGVGPLKLLCERACVPLLDGSVGLDGFYGGLRLVAVDGSTFDVPDEEANVLAFGYPGSRTGFAGFAKVRCGVLVECGSHAVLAANMGAYRVGEWEVCKPFMSVLSSDMLCLADRGFSGYEHWRTASGSGAQLLWRCRKDRVLPVIESFQDGSFLSALYPDTRSRETGDGEIRVRVIEYKIKDSPYLYRLLTTLLDPVTAPANELIEIYHERWNVEEVFDELKTHLTQSRRTFRSKTPSGVHQEFYGWVLAHYAVRWLIHQNASQQQKPDRAFSFIKHVQLLRRTHPHSGDFPPQHTQKNGGNGSITSSNKPLTTMP
jgi:hypothetical protein